ncbi:Acetyl-CoA acetyltransferase [Lentilactobacillus parabuchneri]|uniref:acetyl-CoA C-acetyltransferase n=1 Tax=Lentilactobacillus parabuchneri TaxID=152331 RepID=A0A1X1FFG2_9LACO|nr:thiolase family protein [Lentilactobacillus parabuchneri]APR07407.1 Acetyl-CoA acetyltransferase [Lentilactobacillus parabuchneri]MBW0263974.1 thiolase family protein [Lentilactobacillus parabuchneri]ORN01281.1 Acetyl-CoA acetyltransferase [Lentilactobacillus parabuchneri]ORN10246.1 Acetyl-CoA acetyltransferase [Lentilactobacillus parabuchneri]ORN29943.1 Acetyl-CoA acetyltransferase [Lentilactobacillus parabuchneri]
MDKIVIIDAKRTAIGKLNGTLSSLTAEQLGTSVTSALLKSTAIRPDQIDHVIFGNAIQAGNGQNIARQIELNSGIPENKTAYTVNQVCGSGLQAIHQAYTSLLLGETTTVIAGGTESMSNVPYLNMSQRKATKFGPVTLYDGLQRDGLTDSSTDQPMGMTAENVADEYHVSRHEQDLFALRSHQRAAAAMKQNYFADEIIPLTIPQPKSKAPLTITTDESVRFDTNMEKLANLRPAFKADGTVTAGNSAPLNDGASALLLTTATHADSLDVKPVAEILGYAECGIDPNVMGYAPYLAINKLLQKLEMATDDIDLFEINEAFASQSVAVIRDLDISLEKVNINGGAIALGHPLGDSGARIVTTLIHNLKRTHQEFGIAALCMGGGMGSALAVKLI